MYYWLANVLAWVHAGAILVYLAGGAAVVCGKLGREWPLSCWQKVYLAVAFLICGSHVVSPECLLTRWEKRLRTLELAGTAYADTFIDHYAPFLPGPLADWALMVATLAAFVGVLQVSHAWWRLHGRRTHRDPVRARASLVDPK